MVRLLTNEWQLLFARRSLAHSKFDGCGRFYQGFQLGRLLVVWDCDARRTPFSFSGRPEWMTFPTVRLEVDGQKCCTCRPWWLDCFTRDVSSRRRIEFVGKCASRVELM